MQKALVSWCRRLSWGRHWSTKAIRTRQVAFMVYIHSMIEVKLAIVRGFGGVCAGSRGNRTVELHEKRASRAVHG